MIRVCISGYYGFDNAGDEAILLAMIESLRREFPDIEITVLSDKPEKTAAAYGVKAYDRWKWWQIHKAIMASDIMLSGGGGLLQDVTGKKSILYYTHIMKMAVRRRRPLFIFSQGVGPVNDKWNQNHVAKVLRKAARITVRDDESAALLQSWGMRRGRIHVTADPVLTLGDTQRFWDVERFVRALQSSGVESAEEKEIEICVVDEETYNSIVAENQAKAEAENKIAHKPMNAAAFAEAEAKMESLAESESKDETMVEISVDSETLSETEVKVADGEDLVKDEAVTSTSDADSEATDSSETLMSLPGYGIMGKHPSLWAGDDKKLAVFSLRKWEGLPIADIAAAGNMTVKAGYKVVLLPFQYPADLEVSQQIADAMTEEAEVFDGKEALTPREIMTIMDAADFVFGMRLHSLIMAAVTKTPFASLSYDPKVRSFVQQLGLEITGDLANYDSAAFLRNYEAVLGSLSEVSGIIEERLPELTLRAESVMDSLHLLLDRIDRRRARKNSPETAKDRRQKRTDREKTADNSEDKAIETDESELISEEEITVTPETVSENNSEVSTQPQNEENK